MKLPNGQNAIVEHEKIVGYLLNATHPDNGGKAAFFIQLGFSRDRWEMLATALKTLAENEHVAKVTESPHGKKPLVQSTWIMDKGLDTARLVTAYPHKERQHD